MKHVFAIKFGAVKVWQVGVLLAAALVLTGCGRTAPTRTSLPPGELPSVQRQQQVLNDFTLSQWRGCNTDFERGQILGRDGYQNYWVCWGTTSTEHRYAITLLAAPGNEKGAQVKLEFRRGHEPGMLALLRTFFLLAGVDDEDERLRMRSDVSRYLITPPDVRAMVQASQTPNGLIMEMGYNIPRPGYTTLEINARLPQDSPTAPESPIEVDAEADTDTDTDTDTETVAEAVADTKALVGYGVK